RRGHPRPEPPHPPHRHRQNARLPHHQGIHRPTHRPRQDHPRDQTLPQAIHRPPALPHPHRHHGHTHHQQPGGRLTHLEASTTTKPRLKPLIRNHGRVLEPHKYSRHYNR